jgi:hypothetical protein
VAYEDVPGVVEVREQHGETTVVVEPGQLVDASLHLRDEGGYRFLSASPATSARAGAATSTRPAPRAWLAGRSRRRSASR